MRTKVFLVQVLCLASFVLSPFTRASLAREQCGSPALRLEDLSALARDAALANRVAPHSLHLSDTQLRSELASLRERGGRDVTTSLAGAASAGEQGWQSGFGLPGLHEYPGAAIEYHGELVISGWLRTAGAHPVNGIARWTDRGWQPLGDGIIPGFALAILNDRLYAGDWTGGVSAWDGRSWTRLPKAPLQTLRAILVHDGALFAAGAYESQGRVARFDGVAWQLLGGGFDAQVAALGTYRGDLIAGGDFRSHDGTPCGYVARWNGTTWESLGSGIDPAQYSGVSAIEEFGDRLIVGGWFASCGNVTSPGLAAWDGASWSALPGAPAAYVYDLHVLNGNLYIAGSFAGDYSSVARWDGATWESEGLEQWTLGLATYGGRLAAVGGFYGSGCPAPRRFTGVATLDPDGWNGLEQWEPSMHGLAHNAGAADVSSVALYRGELVVAGIIGLAGNPPEWNKVASPVLWDGQGWQSIGGGSCSQVVEVVGNDLIAAGFSGIARWDGAAWHPMGSGLTGMICAIAEYQGKIYAGGELRVTATGENTTLAVFDGVEWSAVPFAPNTVRYNTPRVSALEVKDGLLYAGGNFLGTQTVASPSVVAWDGRRWFAVGAGVEGNVDDLESFRGDLYAAGMIRRDESSSYDAVMHWDGSTWASMGLENSWAGALGRYGDKLVIAGGAGVDRFASGSLGIVSWDGAHWGGFGSGVNGYIRAIRQIGGDLYVGGTFSHAGDQSSFSIARWAGSEPPPTVNPPASGRSARLAVSSAVVTSNQASVSYVLPAAGRACLELFDARGARVATLCDRVSGAGPNLFEWSAGSPAPFPQNGLYFLRLTSDGATANAKVVFSR
jgi:hypothetical protein